jgi:hypothetical protein
LAATNLNPTRSENIFAETEILERLQSRFGDVRGVLRAERFGQDVFDTGRFDNRTDGFARDNSSTRRGRTQQNFSAAVLREDFMRDGRVLQRNAGEIMPGVIVSFADRVRDLARFAQAKAHTTFSVANNDERTEAKAPAAFYHFGGAINEHDLFDEIALLLLEKLAVAVAPARAASATTATAVATASTALEPAALLALSLTLLSLLLGRRAFSGAGHFGGRRLLTAGFLGFLVVCHNKYLLR